jgi:hypothetical protein
MPNLPRAPRLRAVGLACLLAGFCLAFSVPQSVAATPKRQKVSLLYVLNSKDGALRPTKKPRRYILSLRALEPHVVWFSDRPARLSGSFPSAGFAAAWAGFGFAADPPNAALDYTDPAGRPRSAILELSHPRYSTRSRRLSFQARLIDPRSVHEANLHSHAIRADRTPARRLRDASLFVDEVEGTVIDGCFIEPYGDCSGANLHGTDLAGVDFRMTDLSNTNLGGADLSGADLFDADLLAANLTNVNLTGANLTNANLSGALLNGADLSNAVFCNTTMPNNALNNSDCSS